MDRKHNSVAERIHYEIRMDILSGKFVGGSRLAESTLAKEKRVSRTWVREALRQLVKEDLLYTIPRSGYVVKELSEQDIIDLFKTRESIELVAGQIAMKNISDAEFKLLENNLNKTKAAIKAGAMENMIELDIDFHTIIYKATRSKYLYRICMTLSDYTRRSVIIVPKVAKHTRRDHCGIYDAFKSKDPATVKEAIRIHLKVVKEDILEHLIKIKNETFFDRMR